MEQVFVCVGVCGCVCVLVNEKYKNLFFCKFIEFKSKSTDLVWNNATVRLKLELQYTW